MVAVCSVCRELVTAPEVNFAPVEALLISREELSKRKAAAETQRLYIEMTKHTQTRHPQILQSLMQMAQQFGYAMIAKIFEVAGQGDPEFSQAADDQLILLYWALSGAVQVTKGPIPVPFAKNGLS